MNAADALTAEALHRRLRAARLRLHAQAAASPVLRTVLDELLGDGDEPPAAGWDGQLRRHAGVAAVVEGAAFSLDWSALSIGRAQALRCLPLRLAGETQLRLGMADPWDDAALRAAVAVLGFVPELAAVDAAMLARHLGATVVSAEISKARPNDQPVRPEVSKDGEALPSRPQDGRKDHVSANGVMGSENLNVQRATHNTESSVVDFVNHAIHQACEQGASDVHFECDRGGVTVKLRRDGVMSPHSRQAGAQRAEEVISRIKVLAQLDITERRTPQDGRFRWQADGRGVDLRVSIMPSIHGEDAVLRLLDKSRLNTAGEAVSLPSLGFAPAESQRIRDLARLPHGMLLVTGPTGSGKTTTLYAVMSEFNDGLDKIVTIEDPVEYELSGVLQIPVNERKGLTFAKGLRSILRHDPDRILVGEIRDAETAEIAVQSALTGHQVYTTVHANSIFDVTGRFRHFGLDMFGFMSSLNGVVVQRLLRRLCPHCAGLREPTTQEATWLQAQGQRLSHVPLACGCAQCQGSGYRGRGVIAEVHSVDDALRDLVTGNAPLSMLRQQVQGSGVSTLAQLGARWVAEGATTPDELRRVVGWA